MKKSLSLIFAALVLPVTLFAQLPWDTECTKTDFDNAQTVISKTDNISFSNPVLGLGGGLSIGKISAFGTYSDECVFALSQTGIADKLSFAWQGGSSGTFTVYQSPDHNTWSQIFTTDGNLISSDTEEEISLAVTTRYIKFAASAKTAVAVRKIKVSELKRLSASTDEWPFGKAMVDDADAVKNITLSWTNIVASVSSTDSHFSASLASVGQKNLIDQTTQLTIAYSHAEAGEHTGEIVIAGEGKEVRIAVSGQTEKYNQTLTWIQELGECVATDNIQLNAFTSSGLEVQYISSDSTIAYVENGVVKIVKAGEVTLSATQPGNYKFNPATSISKTLTIRKADPMIQVSVNDLTYGATLGSAVFNEALQQVEGALSWLDGNPDEVLDAGDYVLSVLFTPANQGIYNTRTVQVALHINKAVQTILWENQTTNLTVGTEVLSTAVLSSGLPVTYAFTECLLSIDNGQIMPENEGEVTVVAYHPGNNNYLPTTVIMTVFHISAASETPTRLEQLSAEQMRTATKYLHAGKVYIYYDGSTYDADGKRIK